MPDAISTSKSNESGWHSEPVISQPWDRTVYSAGSVKSGLDHRLQMEALKARRQLFNVIDKLVEQYLGNETKRNYVGPFSFSLTKRPRSADRLRGFGASIYSVYALVWKSPQKSSSVPYTQRVATVSCPMETWER